MASDAVNNPKICAGKRMTANVPSIIMPVTKAVPYRKAEWPQQLKDVHIQVVMPEKEDKG